MSAENKFMTDQIETARSGSAKERIRASKIDDTFDHIGDALSRFGAPTARAWDIAQERIAKAEDKGEKLNPRVAFDKHKGKMKR